jgi:predicted SAM-dependent methyltransferase
VAAIRSYLDDRQSAATKGLPRSWAVRALRLVTTHSFRQSAKLHATKLYVPVTRVKARQIARNGPVRLHLGCGTNRLPGWVNVDIVGMDPELHWDLRWRLPFPDGSATAVFLEHVVEHFALREAISMLDDCRRVLRSGGKIRVGVPDFGRYLQSYAGDGSFIERNRPGRPTPLLAVAEVALSHGHRSVWDGPTLVRTLEEAGFTDAQVRPFGDSSIQDDLDSPIRESESIYAEATKP